MATVQSILQNVAAYINQDPTLPTGTDQTMWISLVNQAQKEWGDTYQWKQLRVQVALTVTVSAASFALPINFKKTMSPLFDYSAGPNQPTKYYEISPSEVYLRPATDKYCFIRGNTITGFSLNLNPAASSGASLVLDIQTVASSLATLQDTLTCPSDQFVTLRTIAKVLSARSDPRFPQIYSESNTLLSSMMEEEAAPSGGSDGLVPNQYRMTGFRIGE